MTAARRWKQVVKQGIAPHCAQQAAAGSTPSPCQTPASATNTQTDVQACAQRRNGSSGSPIKTEDTG